MCKRSFALLLLSACAWTQSLPIDNPSDPTVAVVNGRKISKSEYRKMIEAQDPNMRALAEKQPKVFLEQYALYETMLQAAEKAGLEKQNPFKEKIAMARRQILVSGLIDQQHKDFNVPIEDAKSFYENNKDMYQQAMVRVIFITGMSETRNIGDSNAVKARTPEDIKARAEAAARLAREGKDFAAVAKQYSDDPESAAKGGEFPHPIRPTSANVPANIRGPVLAAKAGDIVGPIQHETGFYIFKIVSNGQATFDQVKDDLVREMKDAGLKHWLDGFKKESSVSIQDEALLTEAAKEK
jgi:parvulin-like peptidyl-prolyl isomerase